jgi:hypothetical protein
MSTNALPVTSSDPPLVRSTESGAFFRGPLALALRALAIAGIVPVGACAYMFGKVDEDRTGPVILMGAACLFAAIFAGQTLLGRASRIVRLPPSRFSVIPAVREGLRGLAEANYVWSLVLSTVGLAAYVWWMTDLDETRLMGIVGYAALVSILGWMVLFLVHAGTELTSAVVEIVHNTSGAPQVTQTLEPTVEAAPPAPEAPLSQRVAVLVGVGIVLAAVTWFLTAPTR